MDPRFPEIDIVGEDGKCKPWWRQHDAEFEQVCEAVITMCNYIDNNHVKVTGSKPMYEGVKDAVCSQLTDWQSMTISRDDIKKGRDDPEPEAPNGSNGHASTASDERGAKREREPEAANVKELAETPENSERFQKKRKTDEVASPADVTTSTKVETKSSAELEHEAKSTPKVEDDAGSEEGEVEE
jgi:hypothetical protein